MRKRLLASLLALSMVLGLLPMTAFAADDPTKDELIITGLEKSEIPYDGKTHAVTAAWKEGSSFSGNIAVKYVKDNDPRGAMVGEPKDIGVYAVTAYPESYENLSNSGIALGTLTITQSAKPISIDNTSSIIELNVKDANSKSATVAVTNYGDNGDNRVLEVTSSEPTVATAAVGTNANTVTVTGVAVGTAKITVTAKDTLDDDKIANYTEASVMFNVKVSSQGALTLTLETKKMGTNGWENATTCVYSSTALNLFLTAMDGENLVDLASSDISYMVRPGTGAALVGKAGVERTEINATKAGTVTIQAIVRKSGYAPATVEKEITIEPLELVPDDLQIIVNNGQPLVYNDTAQTPSVIVNRIFKNLEGTQTGSIRLTDEDYNVTYENNTNAGNATAKVTFEGNYSGSGSQTFTIAKAKVTGNVHIDNMNPTVGDTLTARAGTTIATRRSFQWYTESGGTETEIAGATTETYKVTAADANKSILVKATFVEENVEVTNATNGVLASPTTSTVRKAELVGTVTIAGSNANVGTKLTATVDGLNENVEANLKFQWMRGKEKIADATNKDYTISEADKEQTLTCVVTASETSGYTGSISSAGVEIGKTLLTGTLSIAGGNTVGSVLTASNVTGDCTYTWYRDGDKIQGPTASTVDGANTYTVVKTDRGHTITVKVIGTGGYTGELVATQVIPALVPSQVTGVTATAGDGKVTLRWDVLTDDGGSAITKYTITNDPEDKDGTVETGLFVYDVDLMSYTFEKLVNGTEYTFTVKATNSVGDGEASDAVKATPKVGGTSGFTGGTGGGTDIGTTTPPTTSDGTTSTEVKPSTSGDSATATVPNSTANSLVDQAVADKSENVTVKVNAPANTTSVTTQIPAGAVNKLADETDASLTVATPVADVAIPNETLAALGSGSGTVTVKASVAADESVTISVEKNGQSVGALPAAIKVTAPVNSGTAAAGSGVVAVLVNADGTETILPKSVLTDGKMNVLLEEGSATVKFVDKSKDFTDVDGHWASSSIDFVSSHGLFQGVTDTKFGATSKMSRAMMVTVLHRLESTPDAGGVSFDDVPSDSYYAEAASWAVDLKITTGTDKGFEGGKDISREMMVTMLYRYAQKLAPDAGKTGSYAGMTGASQVSSWADEAMQWAVGSGIIQGDARGLRPGDSTSRAEMAAVIERFVTLITE